MYVAKRYLIIMLLTVGLFSSSLLWAQVDSTPIHLGSETQVKQGTFAAVELVATDRTSADRYCDVDGRNCFASEAVADFMRESNVLISGSHSQAGSFDTCRLEGRVIAHGASIRAYQLKEPDSASCATQQRTCIDGQLNGSNLFNATSCKEG